MDQPIGIALVSDLHAGDANEYPELRTTMGKAKPAFLSPEMSLAVLASMFESLLEPVSENRRFLVCSGDLSTACHSVELERAATFLEQLAEAIKVPKDHRFVVPGNHDIDWHLTSLASKTSDPWYSKQRQGKFSGIVGKFAPSFQLASHGKLAVRSFDGGQI